MIISSSDLLDLLKKHIIEKSTVMHTTGLTLCATYPSRPPQVEASAQWLVFKRFWNAFVYAILGIMTVQDFLPVQENSIAACGTSAAKFHVISAETNISLGFKGRNESHLVYVFSTQIRV